MPEIKINRKKCKGCLLCIEFCPGKSLVVDEKFNEKGVRPVKFKKGNNCLGCALCAIICPDICIEVYK